MEESILLTIRKMIGPSVSYDVFDTDLIVHINTAFMSLYQLGVGPKDHAFRITGETETWSDFMGDLTDVDGVISYVYLKVRMLFDPPTTGTLQNSFKELIKELEWRLNVAVDYDT